MRRRMIVVLALVGALVAVAIPALAGDRHPADTRDRTLSATLTGAGETVPVATDAVGFARITVDPSKKLVCYELILTGISPVAAHVHTGAAGTDGGVIIDLGSFGQALGETSSGCADGFARTLLRDIRDNPRDYYVNIHTAAYPGGELRGQLSR